MVTARERRQAILRTRRNASFRLMRRRCAEYQTQRDLGIITGDEWKRLDELERMRHRALVIEIEDEWDRWPKWFAYPLIGAASLALWAVLYGFVSWLRD